MFSCQEYNRIKDSATVIFVLSKIFVTNKIVLSEILINI
jgi:hypothetical protein